MDKVFHEVTTRTHVAFVPGGMIVKSINWCANGGEKNEAMVFVPGTYVECVKWYKKHKAQAKK